MIRNYPEYPMGSRRWDERIFHPDANGGPDRPISALWKAPPKYVEQILAGIRLLENATVQRAMERVFRRGAVPDFPREIAEEDSSRRGSLHGVPFRPRRLREEVDSTGRVLSLRLP